MPGEISTKRVLVHTRHAFSGLYGIGLRITLSNYHLFPHIRLLSFWPGLFTTMLQGLVFTSWNGTTAFVLVPFKPKTSNVVQRPLIQKRHPYPGLRYVQGQYERGSTLWRCVSSQQACLWGSWPASHAPDACWLSPHVNHCWHLLSAFTIMTVIATILSRSTIDN